MLALKLFFFAVSLGFIVALDSLSVGDDFPPPSIKGVPSCIAQCSAQAGRQYGCKYWERECACTQREFRKAAATCAKEKCTDEEYQTARGYDNDLCGQEVKDSSKATPDSSLQTGFPSESATASRPVALATSESASDTAAPQATASNAARGMYGALNTPSFAAGTVLYALFGVAFAF